VERAHLRAHAEHHGAGSNRLSGSPPAPLTKSEECIPLAFRGGVLEPRLPSRIPEGHEPRNQGEGGYEGLVLAHMLPQALYSQLL
jgi:hypothetical protein